AQIDDNGGGRLLDEIDHRRNIERVDLTGVNARRRVLDVVLAPDALNDLLCLLLGAARDTNISHHFVVLRRLVSFYMRHSARTDNEYVRFHLDTRVMKGSCGSHRSQTSAQAQASRLDGPQRRRASGRR